MLPMDALERLQTKTGVLSFYHEKGVLNGFVKGAVKPLESLFISFFALDFFVGTDKAYTDTDITGNRFYTSLKPWNRKRSDLWDFPAVLAFRGWNF